MSARSPRWELVRTAAGHHARFIASNGVKIMWTETYTRRRAAIRAIELVTGEPVVDKGFGLEVKSKADAEWWVVEVREVDESLAIPPAKTTQDTP